MLLYYVVASASLAIAGLSGRVAKHFQSARGVGSFTPSSAEARSTPFDVLVVVLLIAFMAIRANSVGTDTATYAYIFRMIPLNQGLAETVESIPQEVGFTVLQVMVKSLGGDFAALLWVTSTFTVGAAYWAMKRTSKNFVFSLALYVLFASYLVPFNAVRQGLAVALIFLASTFLGSRRGWVPYVALAALAFSFHASSLVAAILLPLFLTWRVTVKSAIALLTVAAVAAGALFGSPWLRSVVERVSPDYAVYLDWEYEAGIGIYLILAVRVALLIYATALRPSLEDMKYAVWSALGVVSVVIGIQSVVASRISSYFLIFLCILVPNVMRDRSVPTTHAVLLIAAAAVYFGFNVANFSDLIPYEVR